MAKAGARGGALGAGLVLAASSAHAASLPTPVDDLGPNLVDLASLENAFLFAGAALATGTAAEAGFDHDARVATQRHLVSPALADFGLYGGYTVPFVAPVLYGVGLATKSPRVALAGAAAVQAVAVTLVTTGLLKWGTGRAYPLHGGAPAAPDRLDHPGYAGDFSPFAGGFLAAWPSGHTSVTTSMVAALSASTPECIAIPLVGYPLAGAIGLGMVVGDRHWASDVVAGALIGHAIGWSIGSSFRARALARSGGAKEAFAVRITPFGPRGLALTGTF